MSMGEYAKNIQTVEDMWKKRIDLRDGNGRMSEYIVTCDEETAAWVGNDVELMRPIVRCRDCKWSVDESRWCKRVNEFGGFTWMPIALDGFCAWGEPC